MPLVLNKTALNQSKNRKLAKKSKVKKQKNKNRIYTSLGYVIQSIPRVAFSWLIIHFFPLRNILKFPIMS